MILSNYQELTKLIEEINENISKYETTDGRKIKKNNEEINRLIETLNESKKIILDTLNNFKNNIIPIYQNEEIFLTEETLKELTNINNIINGYNSKEILNINTLLYNLKNDNNLEDIKNHIKEILKILEKANIKLTEKDFTYSISVNEFMNNFINPSELFDEQIKNSFETVYWKNPDLIDEIILCINKICESHKKELDTYKEIYLKEILKENNANNILNEIHNNIIKLDNIKNYDYYTTINNFVDGIDQINDYQLDSKAKEDNISKITDISWYKELSSDTLNEFYKNIKLLYDATNEYEFTKKYEPLIKDIITIYDKKNELKDELKIKFETMDKLYKEKDKLDSKLYSLIQKLNKIKNKKKGLFNKKDNTKEIEKIYNDITIAEKLVDDKITEIEKENENITDVYFNNLIITSLNESSTIYDGLYLYLKYITKLNISIKKYFENEELEKIKEEFINFIYSPYNIILTTLKIKDDINFNKLIENKYKLYNINCTITEDNKDLKKTINYLLKDHYLDKCKTSREDIKLAIEINKISKEN